MQLVIALPSAPNKGAFGEINRYLEVAKIRDIITQNAAVLKYFKKASSIVCAFSNEDFFDR